MSATTSLESLKNPSCQPTIFTSGYIFWMPSRAAALALAEQGASIAIVSRTQSELDQTAAEIKSGGGKVITALLDVSNWDMVDVGVRSNFVAAW